MSTPGRRLASHLQGRLPVGLADTLAALPRMNRRLTVGMALATVLIGLAPVGYMVSTKVLIDRLPDSAQVPVAAIALVCGFFALTEIITPFFTAMAETFGYWINRDLRMRLMTASLAPTGIRHLEDAAAQDVLSRAVRIGSSGLTPGAAVAGIALIGKGYVQGVGCAVLLSTFRWWLGPLLLLLSLVVSSFMLRDLVSATSVLSGQSPALRRANYFRGITTDSTLAGELRVFFLGDWALGRFRQQWSVAMQGVWTARRPNVLRAVAGISLVVSAVSWAIALLADSARGESLGVGSFVMYGQALLGFLPMFEITLRHLNVMSGTAVMAAVTEFESLAAPAAPPTAGLRPAPTGDLAFEGVCFGYDAETPVLRGVDLEIPYGAALAIVGLNGAGKTTLIKLLARLYEPDEGRITWAGDDIAAVEVEQWRQHVAVLFQDFLRLPFNAADNVRASAMQFPLDLAALDRAADEANAATVVDALPEGWATRLAKGYRAGVDLSGGQWQRLAAACALYAVHHGAKLLVLDEPSSALDIRAEAQFFERFHSLEGVTRILISHRLAAVRHTDRIVLLDDGTIKEQGTHDSLMKQDGTYAALFRMQRERLVG